MAYNREWDRGKDQWGDSGAWNDNGGRGNTRGREEDYYGEGKRRKHNDGGYGNSSHSYEEDGYDNTWGQSEDYYEDRTQKGHARKRLMPSEASPHVIFLGLDPDFTEADLQAYLSNQGFTVESVTIIRERSTGASKGFGFAQFATVEHARAFVGPSFPFIQVPPPASYGASATTAFYKALETGAPHTGRRVKIDYSQSASPADKGRRGPVQSNDGTRDIGNTQSPLLLFRGLDPLSGPQAICAAMKTSSGPHKEGAKGMKRIILIKDRVTLASWGFAFVEFIDIQSSSAVLAATMSPQLHPNGFRISDKPVAASFAHPYSFQPVDPMRRDEAAIASSSVLGGAEGSWVRYWDEASTVAVLDFKVEEPPKPVPTIEKKKDKKKAKEADTSSGVAALAEASILPVSDKPVTLSFKTGIPLNKGASGAAVKTPASLALGFSMAEDKGEDDEDAAAQAADNQDLKVTATKKVAPMIASKKTANNITKWNQVQEVLNPTNSATSIPTANPAPVVEAAPSTSTAKAKSVTPAPAEGDFEFADAIKMACLLCARQFKSLEQLRRHNKESELHKKNYQDVSLREVARGKAAAAQQTSAGSSSSTPAEPKYRDRAAERRIMHNQPEAPLPENTTSSHGKKARYAEGPPPPKAVTPPVPPLNPGQDQSNVGNRLLKMMGWTEGTGLGATGEGRVDPIQTALYEQGVGLGASKGKDITHLTEGYAGYVNAAKDAARERYGS